MDQDVSLFSRYRKEGEVSLLGQQSERVWMVDDKFSVRLSRVFDVFLLSWGRIVILIASKPVLPLHILISDFASCSYDSYKQKLIFANF